MTKSTTEALQALVDEAGEELRSAEAKLTSARQRVDELSERVELLRQEHSAFLSALRRRLPDVDIASVVDVPTAPTLQAGTSEPSPWLRIARTDVVEKVLMEIEPAGPTEIADYLRTTVGREETRDNISAALAHLKRRDRAHRVAYSRWVAGPEDASTPATARAEEGETPAIGMEGGDADASMEGHGDGAERNRDDRGGASVNEVSP